MLFHCGLGVSTKKSVSRFHWLGSRPISARMNRRAILVGDSLALPTGCACTDPPADRLFKMARVLSALYLIAGSFDLSRISATQRMAVFTSIFGEANRAILQPSIPLFSSSFPDRLL